MAVVLDDRERDLAALCPDAVVRRLTVADVLIMQDDAVSLAIERKTVSDLEASLRDGRLREQRARLQEAYGQRFAYVIEGAIDWADPRLAGAMTGMHLRHRVPVFCTASVRETAALIAHLAACPDKLAPYTAERPAAAADIPKKKVAGKDAAVAMLACVSGVSETAAKTILEAHGDLRGLIAALERDGSAAVSSLVVAKNGRRLGKVGDKLCAALL